MKDTATQPANENNNIMNETKKLTAEPILIKAGDQRVKLGFNNEPPKVDCRVLSEERYQELLLSVQAYKDGLREEIEGLLIKIQEKADGCKTTFKDDRARKGAPGST